jgi:hypothetical protein
VDIHCILIDILRFDYTRLLFSLCFRWFRIVLVVLNAILMSVFLNNFVIVLVNILDTLHKEDYNNKTEELIT